MNHPEILPKLCVCIFNKNVFSGTGVLIPHNDKYYLFTAAHVLYGQSCCDIETTDLTKFQFIMESNVHLHLIRVEGEPQSQKEIDVAVLEVEPSSPLNDLPVVALCGETNAPGLEFIFRGRNRSTSGDCRSIWPCHLDTPSDTKFKMKIPNEFYTNVDGDSGAEVLQGYSGSGIFINNHDTIYFVGIVISVSSHSFPGVNCVPIHIIKEKILYSANISDFYGFNKILGVAISQIRNEVTQELINQRKATVYGDVENLQKKMNIFLADWQPSHLDGFIKDIMIWEKIEREKVDNNSDYRDRVNEAKAALASGNQTYIVKDEHEGNIRFHKIKEEFRAEVQLHLKGTPLERNSTVIANGEIARLLANCNLDFKK